MGTADYLIGSSVLVFVGLGLLRLGLPCAHLEQAGPIRVADEGTAADYVAAWFGFAGLGLLRLGLACADLGGRYD